MPQGASKFNRGDRVIVVRHNPNRVYNSSIGTRGTVLDINQRGREVLVDKRGSGIETFMFDDIEHENYVDPAQLLYGQLTSSLVPAFYSSITTTSNSNSSPPESQVIFEFALGDIVWIAKHVSYTPSSDNPRETDGKIIGTEVREGKPRYRITWEGGHTNQWYHESDLVMKKPNKQKETIKLDESKLKPLIIDEKVKKEIVAVLKQHEHSIKIFEEWGLGEVIKYGRGMTFLFHGPPGTGKTRAAHCISEAMGRELLIISAAEIQSQEPGGANRNIQAAFAESKKKNKTLFLDECDSLITTRSDVGMIIGSEINTLLTEIEKFEGICILATNRIDTLDEALERRISLIVEFPEPDLKMRKLIWEELLPKKMPIDKKLTTTKLAEFSLTGGQIKNCILQAARLAVSEQSDRVEVKHFEEAIGRVVSSKGLMGTTSRYRQDYVKSVATDKVRGQDFGK